MINRSAQFFFVVIVSSLLFSSQGYSQTINLQDLPTIELDMYRAGGLQWKGESTQNTTWNKITETPDGKIWFSGGDHWGADHNTRWEKSERYQRAWGFGNTTVNYYDPATDQTGIAFELDRASALYSNAEIPGHGKIHSNIVSDSEGNLYTAGYMGSSYTHEFTGAYFPKSYPGGAIIKYDPSTEDLDYLGIPTPYGGVVAMYYDEERNFMNGLSVDRERFWRVNLTTRELNRYEAGIGSREMIMDRKGFCYFGNAHGGLTKFDPDTEEFSDIDIDLPGDAGSNPFRATVVSSDNIIYGISREGFVWSFDPQAEQLRELGHVVGRPDASIYTPNIALDEEWQRLYFIAGNHGSGIGGRSAILTILDLNTGQFHWVGQIRGVEGCYGSLVASDHSVYFNSYGQYYDNGDVETDDSGEPVKRPFLVRYNPPKNLARMN